MDKHYTNTVTHSTCTVRSTPKQIQPSFTLPTNRQCSSKETGSSWKGCPGFHSEHSLTSDKCVTNPVPAVPVLLSSTVRTPYAWHTYVPSMSFSTAPSFLRQLCSLVLPSGHPTPCTRTQHEFFHSPLLAETAVLLSSTFRTPYTLHTYPA